MFLQIGQTSQSPLLLDRWGRLLMKRREAIVARREERRPRVLNEVLVSVSRWQNVAKEIGIGRSEQQLMAPAFNI